MSTAADTATNDAATAADDDGADALGKASKKARGESEIQRSQLGHIEKWLALQQVFADGRVLRWEEGIQTLFRG